MQFLENDIKKNQITLIFVVDKFTEIKKILELKKYNLII